MIGWLWKRIKVSFSSAGLQVCVLQLIWPYWSFTFISISHYDIVIQHFPTIQCSVITHDQSLQVSMITIIMINLLMIAFTSTTITVATTMPKIVIIIITYNHYHHHLSSTLSLKLCLACYYGIMMIIIITYHHHHHHISSPSSPHFITIIIMIMIIITIRKGGDPTPQLSWHHGDFLLPSSRHRF